jgi:transcription elongation factor Elf1
MEDEGKVRIVKGYEDLGEISINCSSCGAPLVYIQKVKNSTKRTKIVASCPHCGDKSFETEILGEFYLGPTEFTAHANLETELKDGKVRDQQEIEVFIEGSKGTEIYTSGK